MTRLREAERFHEGHGPNDPWYTQRDDGLVAVDLYKYKGFYNKNKDFFCCDMLESMYEGILTEAEIELRLSRTVNTVTIVVSKIKPEDGIHREIWGFWAPKVSRPMGEVYRAAAGTQRLAWYWLEASE